MYYTGELIKFSPFVFKNGNQPKPKYCIVLGQINDKVMMANLPTSKDHVPSDVMVERGCVDIPERGVNAFVFCPSDQVTSSFSFSRPTFVYGEQVDDVIHSAGYFSDEEYTSLDSDNKELLRMLASIVKNSKIED